MVKLPLGGLGLPHPELVIATPLNLAPRGPLVSLTASSSEPELASFADVSTATTSESEVASPGCASPGVASLCGSPPPVPLPGPCPPLSKPLPDVPPAPDKRAGPYVHPARTTQETTREE